MTSAKDAKQRDISQIQSSSPHDGDPASIPAESTPQGPKDDDTPAGPSNTALAGDPDTAAPRPRQSCWTGSRPRTSETSYR